MLYPQNYEGNIFHNFIFIKKNSFTSHEYSKWLQCKMRLCLVLTTCV